MRTGILAVLLAATLVACGGSDPADDAFSGTGGTAGGGTGGGGTGGATSAQLGSGTGTGFQQGVIGASGASLSAGGSTSLSVSAVQSDGTLYTQQTAITFSSPCIAAGTAEIQPQATVSTLTGAATVTYVAKGCSGPDVVTATATVAGVNRSAETTLTVAQAAIGSITFVSASPSNIALKGTSAAGRPESSTVVFKVLDSSGGPRAGATVNFALNTNVGGITLSSTSAVSDAQGQVQVIVNAGTVAASVRVTATITSPAISTQSSQLTITTGIATAGSMSLSIGCFNVEGLEHDGITTDVTTRLADRFNNPVPDGTAVTYTAEGGTIGAQCTTAATLTEGGLCSVTWRSSNPRPADGRISIIAKAIGEESFVDTNGNGAFDGSDTFTDLAEPYRDDNENGQYDAGEDFFDFNNNGVRNAPDTFFNGVLCNSGTASCPTSGARTTGIADGGVIIMSGSSAVITETSGAPIAGRTMGVSSSLTITLWIRDVLDNILAGGTEITSATVGGGLTLVPPTIQTVPCATPAAGSKVGGATVYSFLITSGTTTGSGFVTVTVESPLGTSVTAAIPVTVQ